MTFLLTFAAWVALVWAFAFARRWVAVRRLDALMRRAVPATGAPPAGPAAEEIPAPHLPVFTEYEGVGQVSGATEAREQFVRRALSAFRTTLAIDAFAALGYACLPILFALASPGEAIGSNYTGIVIGGIYLLQALIRYLLYRTQFRALALRSRSEQVVMNLWTFVLMFFPIPVDPVATLRFAVAPSLRAAFLVSAIAVALLAAVMANRWHGGGLLLAALVHAALEAWRWHQSQQTPGLRLVVLRVFGLDRNGRFLFDGILSFWRHFGHFFTVSDPALWRSRSRPLYVDIARLGGLTLVAMLGQVLLVGYVYDSLPPWVRSFMEWGDGWIISLVMISEWVAVAWFVQYRSERGFIRGQEHLHRLLAGIDRRPRGVDGAYQRLEAGCYDNTWKLTVAEFVRRSDAVLMDLRGYTPERQGCRFEINFLLDAVPIDHVVFVIDADADRTAVRQLLLDCWRELRTTSPNLGVEAPEVRIYVAAEHDDRDIQGVIDLVIHATGTVAIAATDCAPVAWKSPVVKANPPSPYAIALGEGIDWLAAAVALALVALGVVVALSEAFRLLAEALGSIFTLSSGAPSPTPGETEAARDIFLVLLAAACFIRFAGRAIRYAVRRRRV